MNTYIPYEHTYVRIKHPTNPAFPLGEYPERIVLAGVGGPGKERVWIYAMYYDLMKADPDVIAVGDGLTHGYNPEGEYIVSIPQAWCEFFTEADAGRDAEEEVQMPVMNV